MLPNYNFYMAAILLHIAFLLSHLDHFVHNTFNDKATRFTYLCELLAPSAVY